MAFQIVRNDITKISADVIVNTANPEPTFMAGTDSAIYMAAGADRLLEERKKIGVIEEGGVAVTPAFDLPAKYIFHTVGPVWMGGGRGERNIERRCYENCLHKAVELGVESIAFTLISTGVNGFPKTDALQIATSVFSDFLADHELDITLAVFDSESFRLSGKIFAGVSQYIDEHYVAEKIDEEYCLDAAGISMDEECPSERPRGNERPRSKRGERAGFTLRNMLHLDQAKAASVSCEEHMVGAAAPQQRSLDDVVKNLTETWSESLFRLIREKGYDEVVVYKRANVDRKLFSKIRNDKDYQPKKTTAMAFAIALRLNIDETKDFLGRAGYALSTSSMFDMIVSYFIEQEIYNFMDINEALFDFDQPLLG
jgi:O-acetyl-ADP-ribose deacetylase (regulator of RNase III)